jgi:hypothetical protein
MPYEASLSFWFWFAIRRLITDRGTVSAGLSFIWRRSAALEFTFFTYCPAF